MNLPNQITMARILLVPVIMVLLLFKIDFGLSPFSVSWNGESFVISWAQIFATIVFIIAASSDGLDGYIARKNKLVTNLGKLLDPLADKLLVAAVLISLVEMKGIDGEPKLAAWVAIVIISREFAVTGLRQIALLDGSVMAASKWGKWKTAIQITMIISLLINNFPFNFIGFQFSDFAVWSAVIITVYSGIDYFVQNKHLLRNPEELN